MEVAGDAVLTADADAPRPAPDARTRIDVLFAFGAAAILALAAALRLVGLRAASLSIDELNDHILVSGPFGSSLSSANGFPPGYSLAIQSIDWLLPTAYEQRYFSVACGILVVILGGVAAHQWFGRAAVLPTMFILSVHPSLVYLSREARPYALEHVCTALVLISISPRIRARSLWPAAISLSMLMLCTYTSVMFSVVAGLIVVVWVVRNRSWKVLIGPAMVVVGTFVFLLLTLGPDYSEQQRLSGEYPASITDGVAGIRRFVHAIVSIFFGYSAFGSPHTRSVQSDGSLFVESLPFLLTAALLVGAGFVVAIARGRRKGFRYASSSVEIALLALLPVGVWTVLALVIGVDFRGRYFAFTAIPIALLFVVCVPTLKKWVRVPLVVLLLVLAMVSNYHRLFSDEFANTDYQALADYLTTVEPGSEVYLIPGSAIGQVQEYRPSLSWLEESGVRGPYTLIELASLTDWARAQPVDPQQCSYLVMANMELIDPDRGFLPALADHGIVLERLFSSTGVQVYRQCGVSLRPRPPD